MSLSAIINEFKEKCNIKDKIVDSERKNRDFLIMFTVLKRTWALTSKKSSW